MGNWCTKESQQILSLLKFMEKYAELKTQWESHAIGLPSHRSKSPFISLLIVLKGWVFVHETNRRKYEILKSYKLAFWSSFYFGFFKWKQPMDKIKHWLHKWFYYLIISIGTYSLNLSFLISVFDERIPFLENVLIFGYTCKEGKSKMILPLSHKWSTLKGKHLLLKNKYGVEYISTLEGYETFNLW